jgi:hypothetical protein
MSAKDTIIITFSITIRRLNPILLIGGGEFELYAIAGAAHRSICFRSRHHLPEEDWHQVERFDFQRPSLIKRDFNAPSALVHCAAHSA